MTNFWLRRDASTSTQGLSKRGFVYQGSLSRTLGNAGTASAQLVTGDTPTIVYLRESTSTGDSVRFRLFQASATSGASGSAVGVNLNQTVTGSGSVSAAVLSASVSGASVTLLLADDVVAAGSKSGGVATCSKVRTLKPNQTYLLAFQNLGNDTSLVHVTLVWSEGEPEPYDTLP